MMKNRLSREFGIVQEPKNAAFELTFNNQKS